MVRDTKSEQHHGRSRSRAIRVAGLLAMVLGALFMTVPSLAGAANGAPAAPVSNITITQTTSPDQGWFCLPGALVLQRWIHNTPDYFELVVDATTRPCEPIQAKAAIYGMPGQGVAWPQTLIETTNFTISKAGRTVIRFTKTCNPVQFDVLTGDTPQVISPTGPWHGPLLFPFDLETSYQHWGCEGGGTTTTTSPCENYAARQLAVAPATVAPGGSVTVSGLGTPGTTLSVWVAPPAGSGSIITAAPVTVLVPASGQWNAQFTIATTSPTGTWTANAQASDCDGVTSVNFTVGNVSVSTNGPSTIPPAVQAGGVGGPGGPGGDVLAGGDVLGSAAERELPSGAVLSASLTNAQPTASGPASQADSKLAWTGSTVRIPVVMGVALLMAGALLLLRSRRNAEVV